MSEGEQITLAFAPARADVGGVTALVAAAEALARIETQADAEQAADFLRRVRERIRRIEAHYKPIRAAVRKKLTEALDEIKAMEDADLAALREADLLVAPPLLAWQVADRQATEARNRQRLLEEQARAAEERERQAAALRAAAAAAATVRDQQALQRQARAVERAPLPQRAPELEEPVKLPGISTPTRKVAEVTDFMALVRAVAAGTVPPQALTVNQRWLDRQATDLGDHLRYPGVVVRDKPTLAARGFGADE